MFHEIPQQAPSTPLLDTIEQPSDLRALANAELEQLAEELRHFLLYSVGQTGGHFAAGLGVIELTVALHSVLDTPRDDLVWDVGHQAYPHKILTGRRARMLSIRQAGGLSAFPSRAESEYDSFGVGHSSTSVSAALGMAIAKQQQDPQQNSHCVAVIGDGAMTAGMAFEALNHAAHTRADLLVILNDNSMSISENVGGLSTYLANIWSHKQRALASATPTAPSPATLFEELGFDYTGPCDGHNIGKLIQKIRKALKQGGPQILHVNTEKGHGYAPAINNPVAYHALTKIEPQSANTQGQLKREKYQDVFGRWLCDNAARDNKLVGITPAMREGSGMLAFSQRFPERFFDVAIAEQHAVTFAAGLAAQGIKPVLAIYSTFLQRAYDQLIHDVAIQNLNVTFAVDRAGIVGADGPTHSGSFDICFLRCIPQLVIAAPSDEAECYQLLSDAFAYCGPALVRYPRGPGPGATTPDKALAIGRARRIREGRDLCVLNFGSLLDRSRALAEANDYGLCDMRWIKPMDTELLDELSSCYDEFVTVEDGAKTGGAGSAVLEYLAATGRNSAVLILGIPDSFVAQGSRSEVLDGIGLAPKGMTEAIKRWRTRREEIRP